MIDKYKFKDEVDFEGVRSSAETLYSQLGEVTCPYFGNEKVVFNAKGIRHLKFKSDRQARAREDQYPRLRLLEYVPEVLKLSRTVQGFCETKQFETEKVSSRWDTTLRDVRFYEFTAVLNTIRLKVIVKQIENGPKFFWSVIPYWGVDKKTGTRILHGGNFD